jgi:hypothetical protein
MVYNWNKLTVEQYSRMVTLGEAPKTDEVIWALTGKHKNDIKLSEVKTMHIGDLTPKLDPFFTKFFTLNGVLYGFQDMNDLSFGLFADLTEEGKNVQENLATMVSYLYRPVTKMNRWNRFKLRVMEAIAKRTTTVWALKMVYKLLDSIKFEIEEYDPVKCDMRYKAIKQAPASAAHNVASFFLILSKELQTNSRRSMVMMLKETVKTMRTQATLIRDKQKQT